jgi:DNA-binding MarR family transcriptional regulator
MNLKPSTMTRFVEKLKQRGLVFTRQEGRTVYVYPTEKGKGFRPLIDQALKRLYDMYCQILGEEFAVKLTADIHSANLKLVK